jgi:small subunit ribosomal protein S1
LIKDDGTPAKVEETLDFKVIEFNKEAKKIVVSQSKIHEDIAADEAKAEVSEKKAVAEETKKVTKKVTGSIEKTTLGDMDVLSNLKADMEATEKKEKQ